MPFALRANGTDTAVTVEVPFPVLSGGIDCYYEFEALLVSGTDGYVIGLESGTNDFIRIESSGDVFAFVGGAAINWAAATGTPGVNHKYKIAVDWDGGGGTRNWTLTIDDVLVSTQTSTASRFGVTLDRLFKRGASIFGAVELRYFHFVDNKSAAGERFYDARSTSAGTALPETTVNAVDGTVTGTVNWVSTGPDVDISITDYTADKVFYANGANGTLTVAGAYSATASPQPTSIEVRVINDPALTEVVTWTTVDASPTGEAWSGTISVPAGGPYLYEARFGNDITTTAQGTVNFLVGDVFVDMGQSNAWYWFNDTGAGALNAQCKLYRNGTGWYDGLATDKGAVAFCNWYNDKTGRPCALIHTSVSGSALKLESDQGSGYWLLNDNTKGTHYNTMNTQVSQAAPGGVTGFTWWQGETEGKFYTTTGANYLIALNALIELFKADYGTGVVGAIAYLGKYIGETDSEMQAIRNAHIDAAAADANMYGVTIIDQALRDLVHIADHTVSAQRMAQSLAVAEGSETVYKGPSIVSAAQLDTTTVDVTLSHDGGTDFTPTTGITGFTVLDDAVALTTSAAVRQSATVVRLTVTPAIAGTPTAQYLYGADPTVTSAVFDNSINTLPLEGKDTFSVAAVGAKTLTLKLVDTTNNPEASLTGLKWAWFDEVTPNLFNAPTDQGTGETTDGNGDLVVTLSNTTKLPGQTGWFVVTDSDGTTTQSPAHKAFSGPATVDL